MTAHDAVLWAILAIGFVLSDMRWLRVAQREHYQHFRMTAVASLWLRAVPMNGALSISAVSLLALGLWFWPFTIAGIAVCTLLPWPMSLFGRESRLKLTPRARRLAVILGLYELGGCLVASSPEVASFFALFAFALVDLALFTASPLEKLLGNRYVANARQIMSSVNPEVIAITGSYGKTSTKLYVGSLLSKTRSVLVSPASFNNLMGLSRTVNESLHRGTEVFVAEMGTYGTGEIRALCEVFRPSISAITTIGDAHLERMKNRATIVAAKSEITESAKTVVLNVDVPELKVLADNLCETKKVIRCSALPDGETDVRVVQDEGKWIVSIGDHPSATVWPPATGHEANLAIAVGIAIAAGIEFSDIVNALSALPQAPHRAEASKDNMGRHVIDDTYNSNPVGARSALMAARSLANNGATVWTVTPGMIELGPDQARRNAELAVDATSTSRSRLIVVGRTNRRAMVRAVAERERLLTVDTRREAVALVSRDAGPHDVILYENDLPDHYP